MFFRLLLLFIGVPILELVVLIRLGRIIGLWPTLGIIGLTGVVGSALARQQGMSVLRRLQSRMSQGEIPGREVIDGVIILLAGALLLTPGVITDVVGFLGLIPGSRGLFRSVIVRWLKKKAEDGSVQMAFSFGTNTRAERWSSQQQDDDPSDTSYEIVDHSDDHSRVDVSDDGDSRR